MRPTFKNTLIKEAVSYFTHMLLRMINLKALGQRSQVRNPRWRPQSGRAWSEFDIFG